MASAPVERPRSSHIFLSHAGADTQAARQFAETLRRNGFNVWFDKDNLQPGDSWMASLENAISEASGMLVYVGRAGIQAWVDREVRFGLVRNTQNPDFRLIPVLGEGADPTRLPPFVEQHQFVDLRDRDRAPERLRELFDILRGPAGSGAAIAPEYWNEHCPFRSLQTFRPEDSWLFFGRDQETEELLARLGREPAVVVIGNSGSGKSSLIQAGLIPALERGRFRSGSRAVESWRMAVCRPSADPFGYLAESLPGQLDPAAGAADRAALIDYCKRELPNGGEALRTAIAAMAGAAAAAGGMRVLLVVDQFEELFTLVSEACVRTRYIDALLTAARLDSPVPVHLVLSLRADFYGHCLEHAGLSACLQANAYNVASIGAAPLRQAIENRLALAGARAEAGLIDSLLADAGAEPGNLALLEHALTQLWEKSAGVPRTLTNDAYAEIGRLRGALGRHADEVFCELADECDRDLAQRVFLELVQLGEGAQDTRRRVAKESLLRLGERGHVERLIAHLASRRLVATSGEGPGSPEESFVEVSHEALIREWRSLREWLANNREDLRLERTFQQAAEEWRHLQHDASALLRGARLAQMEEWIARHPEAPPPLPEFFRASLDAEEQEAHKEREAAEREAKAAQDARRSAKRNRRLAFALGLAAVAAGGVAVLARSQQLIAQSGALAARAEQSIGHDRAEAIALAIQGLHAANTAEARVAAARAFPQLVATLEGHTSDILHAEFSPDDRRIVTSSLDNTARVWNAATGESVATLTGHTDTVHNAVFSPDGRRIVTASQDGTARVWDVMSVGIVAKLEGHSFGVLDAEFSPDGQRIVTASSDGTAGVWDAMSGRLLAKLEGDPVGIQSAAFSPDGQRIVTASGLIAIVWDATTYKTLARLADDMKEGVLTASFSPDSQRIVTTSYESTARVWNAVTGNLVTRLKGHADTVANAEFSPDGRRIVTASLDGTARIWSSDTGQLLTKLAGHRTAIFHAAFSPDGRYVVTGSYDRTARVWNAATGRLMASLEGHNGAVMGAGFSRDGLRIVTASSDHTARIWNLASGQLLTKLDTRHAAFSPDGKRIVGVGTGNTAIVWSAATGNELTRLQGHKGGVLGAEFSPDGQRIVTGSQDGTAIVWKADGDQPLARLEGHRGDVLVAKFSPDSRLVVTVGADKTARVWNTATGRSVATLASDPRGIDLVAFSPDGRRIVANNSVKLAVGDAATGQVLVKMGGDGIWTYATFSPDGQRVIATDGYGPAQVWNAATGQLLMTLKGADSDRAALSPDGQRLVAGRFGGMGVWNVVTGQQVAKLEGSSSNVESVAFSPDGRRIVTGSEIAGEDGTARVWNADTGRLVAKLEGHRDRVEHAVFSSDGQRILTTSQDGTARVYRILTLADMDALLGK
jgi:WD40 repeat protein